MILKKSIEYAIEKYGSPFQLELSPSENVNFKGVPYPAKNTSSSKDDVLHSDPNSPSNYMLITSDPFIIKNIDTDMIIYSDTSTFQTVKYEHFGFAGKTYYLLITLLPIKLPKE